jgi:hypothetical protein
MDFFLQFPGTRKLSPADSQSLKDQPFPETKELSGGLTNIIYMTIVIGIN